MQYCRIHFIREWHSIEAGTNKLFGRGREGRVGESPEYSICYSGGDASSLVVVTEESFKFVAFLEVGAGMNGGDNGGGGKVGCLFFVSAMMVGKMMVEHGQWCLEYKDFYAELVHGIGG